MSIKHAIQVFCFTSGAAVLGTVAWLAIQVNDRSMPVADVKIDVLPAVVEQGEAVQVDVKVFYRRSCKVHVARRLYDALGEKYALADINLPPGTPGLQHSVSTVVIAPNFRTGEARYVSTAQYSCNWFQRVIWPITSQDRFAPFVVIKRGAS